MDFKELAKTICSACRAVLLPEGILQKGRGMNKEHCPSQVPHPWPGKRLFVHMADGKLANPALKGFAITPSWCIHGKNQSCLSCKPFIFVLCISSPLKTLTIRATPTHVAVVWAEEIPCSKPGILTQNTLFPCKWWAGMAHFTWGVALSGFHPHTAVAFTLCNAYKGIFKGERGKILCERDQPLSELCPSVSLALSVTVSCPTVCYPLALNWSKTA